MERERAKTTCANPKRMRLMPLAALALIFGLSACERPDMAANKEAMYPPVEDVPLAEEPTGEPDPIANPDAPRGGMFTLWGGGYPKSFNYWLDTQATNATITSLLYETLATLHPTEDRFVGSLATEWEVSEDGRTFTFKLDPRAKWSDGEPITAEDVQFYYDAIMNPEHDTTPIRVSLSILERPEIIDEHTLSVTGKSEHWRNFAAAAGLTALPKHAWGDRNFNEVNQDFSPVSGPYQWHELAEKRYLVLKRRGDWWGRAKMENQGLYNFDYIRFRFEEDRNKALDRFKRGDFDQYAIYTARIWAEETEFPAVQKNHVIRQRVFNKEPIGFQGLAINMRREMFKDPRVREALSYLLDRETINEKIMYDEYFLLNSFYPDLYEDKRNPAAPLYEFNPEKARELLSEAGWEPNAEGKLAKDGRTFSLTLLNRGSGTEPHMNIYIDALRKVGIEAQLEITDQATFTKRMDNFDYDMAWVAWGAGRLRDPEPTWHGSHADETGSFNMPGVKSEEIDALIEKQRGIMDLAERNKILKQIDANLTRINPYVLLWMNDNNRLLYWNKFGMPENPLGKYNREDAAIAYWWVDPVKEQALAEAKKTDTSLPEAPDVVKYKPVQ